MPKTDVLYLVVPNKGVVDTGTRSFMFMHKADVPAKWRALRIPQGPLLLESGEWTIELRKGGQLHFGWGGKDSPDDNALTNILHEVPEAILLVEKETVWRLQPIAVELGIELIMWLCPGKLQTHYEKLEV